MTNDFPKKMEIELKDEDIEDNLVKIIKSMSKTRAETVSNSEFSDKEKEEYKHLAYRLASCLESLADGNDGLLDVMKDIVAKADENQLLLSYDAFQEGYWRKNLPGFEENLEKAVIYVMKDNFSDVEVKHHFWQAIKYLGVKDSSQQERDAVVETILPFHNHISFEEKGYFKHFLISLFGYTREIEDDDRLNVRIDFIDHFRPRKNISPDIIKKIKKVAGKLRDHGCFSFSTYVINEESRELFQSLCYKINCFSEVDQDNNEVMRVILRDQNKNDHYDFLSVFKELARSSKKDVFRELDELNMDYKELLIRTVDKFKELTNLPIRVDMPSEIESEQDFNGGLSDFFRRTRYIINRYKEGKLGDGTLVRIRKSGQIATIALDPSSIPEPFYHIDFDTGRSMNQEKLLRKEFELVKSEDLTVLMQAGSLDDELIAVFNKAKESAWDDLKISKQLYEYQGSGLKSCSDNQNITGYVKSSMVLIGPEEKYVLTFIRIQTDGPNINIFDDSVTNIFEEKKSLEEKLKSLVNTTEALYAHVLEYKDGEVKELEAFD
jgi:hypothetical protein